MASIVDGIDTFVFDCDGVLWHGERAIPGAAAAVRALARRGKQLYFVTNNSTKSRVGYKSKFDELGLTSVQPEEIFSSR